MELKVKKLQSSAIIPQYATAGAACFDIHAVECVRLPPYWRQTIKTGLAFEVPEGYALMVYSCSGHGAKKGVRLANCTGVIDSDYRGELMVALSNDSQDEFVVEAGDRIAQAMLVKVPRVDLVEVNELSETERGAGGFGSTGTR